MSEKITSLGIDIETFSDKNLEKTGVYPYAESKSFEILLLGYSVNFGPANVIDIAQGEVIPNAILDAIVDPSVEKWAFNANFERIAISAYLQKTYPALAGFTCTSDGKYLSPEGWKCSMVLSAYNGLPQSLEDAGSLLLKSNDQKLKEGKELILTFCQPCKPTAKNGYNTRILPSDEPEKWRVFKAYNLRDVEANTAIIKRLWKYAVPDSVWEEYHRDQEINDRGVLVDMQFVKHARRFCEIANAGIEQKMKDITGIDNPNSPKQLKDWLALQNIHVKSLNKKFIDPLIEKTSGLAHEVLLLHKQLSMSSVTKYEAMLLCACSDKRVRGMFRFYGAARSGRWSGKKVQLQNLPQTHLDNIEEAREMVKSGDFAGFSSAYPDMIGTLSQLIRTALIAEPGNKFIICDYSSIEARVLSYVAKEKWRMEVFNKNGDIYCANAEKMFGVPVEKNGVNGHLRPKGKIAELALGYGGSVGALENMGALDMGIKENELLNLVTSWRDANPKIVALWNLVNHEVLECIEYGGRSVIHGISIEVKGNALMITLPSGRRLSYVMPQILPNKYNHNGPTYCGITDNGKWGRIESYGAKFVENIIQGISRDILAYAMKNLHGFRIVAHIHDELVVECSMETTVDDICREMEKVPEWIPGLPLHAEGFESDFYTKG